MLRLMLWLLQHLVVTLVSHRVWVFNLRHNLLWLLLMDHLCLLSHLLLSHSELLGLLPLKLFVFLTFALLILLSRFLLHVLEEAHLLHTSFLSRRSIRVLPRLQLSMPIR